jgi:4-azaleucine resistance transporter AzlC
MNRPPTRTLLHALRATAPVAAGYVPLGIAFGAFTVTLDLPWYLAPLTALVVFAGSMEFLLLGLIVSGAGLAQIATTTLLVNSRHVFYGVSYPWHLLRSPAARFYGAFALTDETYALINSGVRPQSQTELMLIQGVSHFYWVGGAVVGALVGSFVPDSFDGFDFALTGLFALLFVGALRAADQRVTIVLTSLTSVALGLVVPGELFLLVSMSCYTLLCLVLTRRQSDRT